METTRSDEGLALLGVLLVLTVLTLLAMSLTNAARQEIVSSSDRWRRAEAEALAEAALHRAIFGLIDPLPGSAWRPDGAERSFTFVDREILIRISDETAKIDLNAADVTLLANLFKAVGLEDEEADALADRIADWRDADDLVRLNGAEARAYRAEGLHVEPRNAPFETIDEVRRVMGMSHALYDCIKPALTVYSGRARVNFRAAPPLVRKALGLLEQESNPPDEGIASSTPFGPALAGRALAITVEVPVEGVAPLRRHTIVRLTGNARDPFWVHAQSDTASDDSEDRFCELLRDEV